MMSSAGKPPESLMNNENKRLFNCLLTNSLLSEIICELVRKHSFQPQYYVKNVHSLAIPTYKQSNARKR